MMTRYEDNERPSARETYEMIDSLIKEQAANPLASGRDNRLIHQQRDDQIELLGQVRNDHTAVNQIHLEIEEIKE